MRKRGILAVVGATALFSLPASALELDLDLKAETEYTTNSGRTATDETDEVIFKPGVDITATHESAAIQLDVDYSVERRIYQEDLFDDDTVSNGTANLTWNALPERLDFVIDHSETESVIDALTNDTQNNRQTTTNSSAGPILRFNPRGEDAIEVEYRYGRRSSERTEQIDAITHQASARYRLALSSTNMLTFAAINNQVQYELPSIPDLEYQVGQATWSRMGANSEMHLTGGYSKTSRTLNRDDVNGAVMAIDLTWQARPSTRIELEAARDIRDQSTELSNGQVATAQNFSVNSNLAEVFTNTRANVRLTQELDSTTSFSIGALYDEQDFEDIGRDVESSGISVGFNRTLNPSMTLRAVLSQTEQDFADQNDTIDLTRGSVGLEWNLTQRIDLGFGVEYQERDSDNPLDLRTYDEWIGLITFTYNAVNLSR